MKSFSARQAATIALLLVDEHGQIKEANQVIAAFDKQKTEEHRSTQAKRLSPDVKAGLKELGEKLGLTFNLSHLSITPRGVVNIGVTTALLPNKGMPLPFISFGGSNLVICFFMIGVLINIHCHGHPLVETVSPALKRVRNFCRL